MFPAFKKAGLAVVLAAAATAGTAGAALADPAPPPTGGPTVMAGSSTQSRGGLTCNNRWYTTLGKTNCTGNSSQRWRLKLTCQLQRDIYGTWQQGPGSDQNECNVRVSGASIQWG